MLIRCGCFGVESWFIFFFIYYFTILYEKWLCLGNYILFYFWSFIKINFQSIAFYLCAAFWVNVFSSFSSPIFSLCVADNLFNPHPSILSSPNVFPPYHLWHCLLPEVPYFKNLWDLCQSPIPCSFKKISHIFKLFRSS